MSSSSSAIELAKPHGGTDGKGAARSLGRRILWLLLQIGRIAVENLVVFITTTLIVFALIRSIPGDEALWSLGPGAAAPEVESVGHTRRTDQSFLRQYSSWVYATLTLNLGISSGFPNAERIKFGTWVTCSLTLGAILVVVLIGVPIGLASGLYPESWLWNQVSFLVYLVSMVPIFLLAYASFFFWPFPPVLTDIDILVRLNPQYSETYLYVAIFSTMAIVLAVGDGTITELVRAVREEVGRIADSEFIRAVRANGGAVWKHLARNLLVPILTVLNLRILYLLGGAVVVESVFEYPGLGQLTVEAVKDREYGLVFAITVVSVLLVLLVTVINKFLILFLDPRARD